MNTQPNAVLFAAVCKRAGCATPYAVELGRALAEEFSKPLDAEAVRLMRRQSA